MKKVRVTCNIMWNFRRRKETQDLNVNKMRTYLRGKRERRRAVREAVRRRRGRATPPRPPPRPAAPPLRHNSIIHEHNLEALISSSSRPRCDKTCATAKNYVSQWIRGSGGGGGGSMNATASETSSIRERTRAGSGASQQTRGVRAIANLQSIKSARCCGSMSRGAHVRNLFIHPTQCVVYYRQLHTHYINMQSIMVQIKISIRRIPTRSNPSKLCWHKIKFA